VAEPSPAATAASPAPGEAAQPQPGFDSEARVGEIYDTDLEGAGLDQLIRDAREDPDPNVREAAVIALGDSDDDRALDALIAATEDRDTRVVLAAIEQLSWFDDRLAQDAIRRLVDSPNREIAEAAREELDE
jgi:HEAT repeat protein